MQDKCEIPKIPGNKERQIYIPLFYIVKWISTKLMFNKYMSDVSFCHLASHIKHGHFTILGAFRLDLTHPTIG